MILRLSLMCILGVVFVSAFGFESEAYRCPSGYTYSCPSIGGTRICTCWRTGSEICDSEVTGLGNIKDCMPGVNCPVVTCSVFGTVDLGDGSCPDPDVLDPDCGVEGVSYCVNPAGNAKKAQGNPFIFPATLSNFSDIEKCERNGKCKNTVEIEPEDCPDCCINPKWDLLTFTASEFNGEVCVCPGGFSAEGDCCSDGERNIDGSCASISDEVCVVQRCTADLTGYKPGKGSINYDCTELPQ